MKALDVKYSAALSQFFLRSHEANLKVSRRVNYVEEVYTDAPGNYRW